MKLTALIHSVEEDSFFTVIIKGKKVYFYLQKSLIKKFYKYLEKSIPPIVSTALTPSL